MTGAILRHPDPRDHDDQLKVKQARAQCPHLDALADHISGFAEIMAGRHGERLDTWIAAVNADDLPYLHRFVTGLDRD